MAAAITSDLEAGIDPVVGGARVIGEMVAQVREQLTFVADRAVLGDLVLELSGVSVALDGLRAQVMAQAEAAAVPRTVGVRTMGQFVGSQTNQSPVRARHDASVARWLRSYGVFAEAFYAGDLSHEHVRLLKTLETPRTVGLLGGDQQLFVDAAVGVASFDAFKKVCEYWLVRVDPDGEEPKDQLKKNSTRFQNGSGGRGKMIMDMDAISFAAAKKMIDHRADKLRAEAEVRETPATAYEDRFAATMSLLVDGFARADGTLPVPIINVVMSQKVADWARTKLTGTDAATDSDDLDWDVVPVDPFDIDGRCELIDGTAVHPLLVSAVTSLWQLSSPVLRRYVMTAKNRIVDYSYNARGAPEHLRTAALIESRGRCVTPGCDAPHNWLQIDHDKPHSKSGPTSLPNLRPLCRPDNHAKSNHTNHFGASRKQPPDDEPDEYRPAA